MEKTREHWGSRIGFLLAAIGSTIGLGLLWKFPYVVGQNGGGLFLFTYFVCVLIIGIPLFIGEIILGRRAQRAAVGAFETIAPNRPNWKSAGYLGMLASFIIMSFYSVIAGWGMSYILMSIGGLYKNRDLEQIGAAFEKLSGSGEITIFWHFVFTAITMLIVMSGVRKGIEYWSKIMVRVLLIMLVGLFLFSCTLPGFNEAARFLFVPKVSGFSVSSVLEALGLAFMTMSLGQGIMISYGSYLRPSENIVKMAFIVAGSVLLVAIFAGLMIFPVVFSFNLAPNSGPGLVFKTLPVLFAQLPGSMVLSTIFFTLFVFTALTSAVPLIEVVTTNIMEKFGTARKPSALLVSLATFVFGIPSALSYSSGMFPEWSNIFRLNFLDTMNEFVSVWIIPIAGLLTAIFLGFVMEDRISSKEFCQNSNMKSLWKIWHFFIRWVVPFCILAVIIEKSGIIGHK